MYRMEIKTLTNFKQIIIEILLLNFRMYDFIIENTCEFM